MTSKYCTPTTSLDPLPHLERQALTQVLALGEVSPGHSNTMNTCKHRHTYTKCTRTPLQCWHQLREGEREREGEEEGGREGEGEGGREGEGKGGREGEGEGGGF